jgi:predicted dienelactone hydrolase
MPRTAHLLSVLALLLLLIAPAHAQDAGLTLPVPTGSAVGYRQYALTDPDRAELFTDRADDLRAFPIAVYYPASPAADAVPAPYAPEAESAAYQAALMIPAMMFDRIQAQVYVDAPLLAREGGYPVLLFSPGFGLPVRFYSALLSEVASRGFVIAVVDHPYSQMASVFPDGTTLRANDAGSDVYDPQAQDVILRVWVEDTVHTLDVLAELNVSDSVLAGGFDLQRVGAFGHSFGGATAANVTLVDTRVSAALNMDGTVFGAAGEGVAVPFMVMSGAPEIVTEMQLFALGMTREAFEALQAQYTITLAGALSASSAPYHLHIEGAIHNTFSSDLALLQVLLPMFITPDMVGTIDPFRANEVIAAYTVAFFEAHLLGQAAPLLEAVSEDYPEVRFLHEG